MPSGPMRRRLSLSAIPGRQALLLRGRCRACAPHDTRARRGPGGSGRRAERRALEIRPCGRHEPGALGIRPASGAARLRRGGRLRRASLPGTQADRGSIGHGRRGRGLRVPNDSREKPLRLQLPAQAAPGPGPGGQRAFDEKAAEEGLSRAFYVDVR